MLSSLHIENIAVIEEAEINFDSGLNVLSGETGAGKSMVIDSINAVLGERISRDVVRNGSEQAKVTAVFTGISAKTSAALEELGYAPDEEQSLLIQRTISAEGKGNCRINGQPVTVSVLRTLGRMLVNIHGQHENQALLSPEKHVEYLDRLGGLIPMREVYSKAYQHLSEICRELEKVSMDDAVKARRLDMLHYQIEEIEEADLHAGEQEELAAQRALYRNAEKIANSLAAAHERLSGNDDSEGVLSLLKDAVAQLKDAGRYVDEMAVLSQKVESMLYDLEECAEEVRDYASHLDFESGDLERVEERLDQIHRMTSKYGPDEEAVLQFLENARRELDSIEMSDIRISQLQKEKESAEKTAYDLAKQLSDARRAAADDFAKNVCEQLAFMDMPGVRMKVEMEPVELGAGGIDKVEFLIAANAGETPKSIAKIASGGELSRIMLAIKSVMADVDDIDTLVFDEIDTGISGRAAQKVGVKLRETGCSRQILCVTHLAQIAAQAHHHFLIEKTVHNGRTFTDVTPLNEDGRERELARIIGGEVTTATLEAAREMREKVNP